MMRSATFDQCLVITYCQVQSCKNEVGREKYLLFSLPPSFSYYHRSTYIHPCMCMCMHTYTYTQKASVLIQFAQLLCTIRKCRCSGLQGGVQFHLKMKYMINIKKIFYIKKMFI